MQTPEWTAYCEWVINQGKSRCTFTGFADWMREQRRNETKQPELFGQGGSDGQ